MLLTTPIWLFALAAIGIPVMIHLWNIKPGKTLKVGSISLFTESSPKSSRSFKLLDILLLLLRCLLLILLAFLLAAPLWQQHLQAGKAKGWLLVPKANFTEVYHRYKSTIDSANKQGYEFHYFDKDFPKADLNELLLHPAKDTISAKPVNYWALVKQLGHYIPASVKAEVFTPNSISYFEGDKPATNLNINWHTYTPADSVKTWLAEAWLTANGNIRVMQATTTPTGTSYQYNDVKNGGQSGGQYSVGIENGQPVVTLGQSKLPVDTTVQRIAIYADKNIADANYLKAALNAIAQLTQRKTLIKTYTDPNAIADGQSWIYWLSDKPVANTIAQKTSNLFTYQTGKVNEVNSWISNSGAYSVVQSQTKITLSKTVSAKPVGNAIWTDGFGSPILSVTHQDKLNTYHFYSRFNPGWNELVWSDEFPKWLLTLNSGDSRLDKYDNRGISAEQLLPAHTDNEKTVTGAQINYVDLSRYLWIILALAFFIERWLATKNKLILTNG
jgi:hypothetical protein